MSGLIVAADRAAMGVTLLGAVPPVTTAQNGSGAALKPSDAAGGADGAAEASGASAAFSAASGGGCA